MRPEGGGAWSVKVDERTKTPPDFSDTVRQFVVVFVFMHPEARLSA